MGLDSPEVGQKIVSFGAHMKMMQMDKKCKYSNRTLCFLETQDTAIKNILMYTGRMGSKVNVSRCASFFSQYVDGQLHNNCSSEQKSTQINPCQHELI